MGLNKLNLTVLLLVAISGLNAFTYRGTNEFCKYLPTGYSILKTDVCEEVTCQGSGESYDGAGCGIAFIQLSPEQIKQGCVVKQVEISAASLYPECCRKFVSCPEDKQHN